MLFTFPFGMYAQQEIKGKSQSYSFSIKSRSFKDITPPTLTISSPVVPTTGVIKTLDKQMTISGYVKDPSGIFEITINGQDAALTSEGRFLSVVQLVVGSNAIFISATDGKNNTISKTMTIERNGRSYNNGAIATSAAADVPIYSSNYYALIIGINNYDDPGMIDLDQPINDATQIYNVLTQQYSFETQNVTFLKNPTRANLIDAIDKLGDKVSPNDNLLIFYAGHGYWDSEKRLGYWLPSDARKNSTANWFRNSTLSDYISSLDTKHTLLIADACFSGSIFKTRKAFNDADIGINKLHELPSRKAMTSGTLKEVPDRSVFVEYFIKRLNQNSEKYISSEALFSSMRTAILNNSPNIPQYGEIHNAGDEGGDFIFIRR